MTHMFRWLALFVFAAALGISTWHRWLARRQTASIPRGLEPSSLIAGRLLVAGPMFGGVIAYLANPDWMAWASVSIPSWMRWLGVALGLLTVPTVYWVLRTLGSNVSETILTKEEQRLVTAGPYRWVRHPLYGAGIVLFLSIGLMSANAFILVCAVVALIGLRFVVIPREEAQLRLKFGNDYVTYQQRTGSLLPTLRAPPAGRCAG
jgi:protein-S-isoprenylcysteine O-methyltransferase Ste14